MIIPFPPADPTSPACPSCGKPIAAAAESCHACGYAAEVFCARRHFDPPALLRWHDADGLLRLASQTLNRLIDGLERRFGQVRFCIYAETLPPEMNADQFAEWFLVNGKQPIYHNRNERQPIVVVIDPRGREVAVATAAALDAWIPNPFLQNAAGAAAHWLSEGNWEAAVRTVLESLRRSFNEIWPAHAPSDTDQAPANRTGTPHLTVLPSAAESPP